MIQVKDVVKTFDGFRALDGLTMTVPSGSIYGLVGPNGAGKSTILRHINGVYRQDSGEVLVDGAPVYENPAVKARLASIPDELYYFLSASTRDMMRFFRGFYPRFDQARYQALKDVFTTVDERQSIRRLSKGMQKQSAFWLALCCRPDVLVLDEPTSFLDIRHKLELLAILKDMVRERRLAVLMSLHELDLAQKISDFVVCVHGDVIERQGPPEEIFTSAYIMELYGAARGSYNALFGSLELEAVRGEPEVFVIGGAGAGIPVYRQLQRRGVPFAAGVLQENDVDFPVAAALAVEVVSERSFQPVGEDAFRRAAEAVGRCKRVLCPLREFGPMNEKNRQLRDLAQKMGKLEET